jgi:hypothetical protein
MSYPWTFPNITPAKIEFVAKTQASKFTSPFTGRSQVVRYQAGQWWECTLTFPPLTATDAQTLSGFITGLSGQQGTFYYKLPSKFRLSGNVAITVGGNGNDVTVNTGTPQVGLYGTDSVSNRLVQFTSATSIFPALAAGNTTINPTSGSLFRLASNEVRYTVDEAMMYGFVIPVIEAI